MGRQTYYYQGNDTPLSGVEVARVAYQAGFRGDDLVKAVAIAGRESGWKPGVHGSDSPQSNYSGDRGLFQINSVNDQGLKAAGIITSATDLFDPLINAKAAFYLYKRSGNSFAPAWSVGQGGWNGTGDPMTNTNVARARDAVAEMGQTYNVPVNVNYSGGNYRVGDSGGGTGESAGGIPFIDIPGWGTVQDAGGAVMAFVGWFFDKSNWIRIIQVIGGMVCLGMGLYVMVGRETLSGSNLPIAQIAAAAA